ncbi:MAG: class I SAM-dependent methyltransferase [Anaerolineae bacterium]
MSERENVAQVLAKLKGEIRSRKIQYTEPTSSKTLTNLRQVYATARVNPHLPIGWPKMPPGIIPKIVAIIQKVVRRLLRWYINPIVEQQNAYNAAVTAALETQVMHLERLEAALKQAAEKVEQLEATLKREAETTQVRLRCLERVSRAPVTSTIASCAIGSDSEPLSYVPTFDYFHLELQFRGPQLLQQRQVSYLKYFEGRQNILDIGCGRGEFVEMLLRKGISARGIDLEPYAVAYAQERGIPVEQAEAITYLQSLPDESLGGVFASQVIEHLQPRKLAYLLKLCHNKLATGAPIVLETLNPACLFALANWFVIDPTHVWPVHSETLKFMLESAGFSKIEIEFLSPVPLEQRLLAIPPHAKLMELDAETMSLLNRNIDLLNNAIFGYQDYAAIAWRASHE